MLLSPSAQWGFGVSNLIFPPTWKAEEHVTKQFMSCESLSLSWVPDTPACTHHHPAPGTGFSSTTSHWNQQKPAATSVVQLPNCEQQHKYWPKEYTFHTAFRNTQDNLSFKKKNYLSFVSPPHPPWVSQQKVTSATSKFSSQSLFPAHSHAEQ